MLEKGFLRNQENENSKHQKLASTISKTLLYLGAIVLIGSFVYLLVNGGTNDLLIGMLMPFMITGLGLILVSWLISRAYSKLRR